MNKEYIKAEITGKYRVGDIRHCFADISKAEKILEYKPRVSFEEGLQELSEWLQQQVAYDKLEQASEQLASRGLTV